MSPSPSWVWFDFVGERAALEHLQAELLDSGCVGGEELQVDGEPAIRLFWEVQAQPEQLIARLDVASSSSGARRVAQGEQESQDWLAMWKAHYAPMQVSDDLWVAPAWADRESIPAAAEATVIRIHPAMAFGTGDHPTTQMCLRLLQQHIDTGDRVLDVGCGSGILSIAAVLLGADRAVGVDIDPEATANAALNAKINEVAERVQFHVAAPADWPAVAPTHVVCNIITAHLVPLLPAIGRVLGAGVAILSGVDKNHQTEVRRAIGAGGLCIKHESDQGEWCAFVCRKAQHV